MDRFQKAIFVAIGLIGVVAIFDFFQYPSAFWMYSFALAIVAASVYYIFKKDLSEAVAVFAAFYIMIMFGLEDLIFYIIRPVFQETPFGIPPNMEHLYTHPVIGKISYYLGFDTVTPIALVISVAIGAIITYFVVKWLKKQTW